MIDLSALRLADLEVDPHPILAELRSQTPAAYVPAMDMWLITRWEDVVTVCDSPQRFAANTNPSWLRECLGENMLTLDHEDHRRLATGMRPPFAGTEMGRATRDLLPSILDDLIDGFIADGAVDLMTAYAEPIANLTLLHALGLRDVTWEQLAGWCRGVITGLANFENQPEKTAIAAKAHHELGAALNHEIDLVERGEVKGSGLAMYVAAGFTRAEIVNNVRLMISGGINEPRDGIGLVVYELLSRPGLSESTGTDLTDLRRVMDEAFRYHSPVGTATRQATEDAEMDSPTIPRGSIVAAVLTAANRDPARWSEPDRFLPDRREGASLAFATGAHRCLGEWMARQQVLLAVERLLSRLPGLRLEGEVTIYGFEFRGPLSLPVAWG
jgi:cytochrome P450